MRIAKGNAMKSPLDCEKVTKGKYHCAFCVIGHSEVGSMILDGKKGSNCGTNSTKHN